MLPRRIAGDAAELHSGRDAVFIGHSGRLPWHRRRRDSRCGGRSGGSTDHSNSRRIHAQTPCDRRTDRIQCHSDGMCGFHVSSAHGGHVGVACGGCAAHIAAQKRSGPRIQQNGMLFADTSFHPCHMGTPDHFGNMESGHTLYTGKYFRSSRGDSSVFTRRLDERPFTSISYRLVGDGLYFCRRTVRGKSSGCTVGFGRLCHRYGYSHSFQYSVVADFGRFMGFFSCTDSNSRR